MVINHNRLAVLIGIFIIILCITVSYIYQKTLFSKYRQKVANTMNKNKQES